MEAELSALASMERAIAKAVEADKAPSFCFAVENGDENESMINYRGDSLTVTSD